MASPGVLKAGGRVHPALLEREVQAARDKQRSPDYCDDLLRHLRSLPAEGASEAAATPAAH